MSKKILGAAGLGLISLGSTLFASPANAALTDCGTAPTGGTLEWDSATNVCTLTFDSTGSYSFTPSVVSDLQAILVGGGGGADAHDSTGYAGTGGRVTYSDLSTVASGTTLTLTVGQGGASAVNGDAGTSTSISYGSTTLVADGGISGGTGYCALNGSGSTYVGFGSGAFGNSSTNNGETCGTTGPGVNPSLGNVDNNSSAVPTHFTNYNFELGKGGDLTDNTAIPTALAGQGGSVDMDTQNTTLVSTTNGADGLLVFRWTPAAALAATGTDSSFVTGVAAGAIVLGIGMTLAAVRRRVRN